MKNAVTDLLNVSGFENSSSKAIYEEVNQKVEKWTKILYFVLMNVSLPGIMMPNFVISYFLYFSTDLEVEAFRFPFPIWFVNILNY